MRQSHEGFFLLSEEGEEKKHKAFQNDCSLPSLGISPPGSYFVLISGENLKQLNWHAHQLLRLSPMQTWSQPAMISLVWSEGGLLQKYPIPICQDMVVLWMRPSLQKATGKLLIYTWEDSTLAHESFWVPVTILALRTFRKKLSSIQKAEVWLLKSL